MSWNESLHPRGHDGKFGKSEHWLNRVEQALPHSDVRATQSGGSVKFNPRAPLTEAQTKQMHRWRRDAQKPAGGRPTRRAVQVEIYQKKREQAAQRYLMSAVDARQEVRGQMWSEQQKQDWIDSTRNHRQKMLDDIDEHLARLADPTYNTDQLDITDYSGRQKYLANKPDPKHPLAIYGDLLHMGGGAATHRHLEMLEQIPVEFHAAVAEHMLQKRPLSRTTEPRAGIWVSGQPVSQIDSNYDLATVQPRGWGKGDTWNDVDGVYRAHLRQMVAGHSKNADNHGHSAAGHEFGHALDDALDDASNKVGWVRIHQSAVDNALVGFNPYFKQSGHAGAQEFWAEAFGAWARGIAEDESGDPDWQAAILSRRLKVDHADAVEIQHYFETVQRRVKAQVGM